MKAELPLDPVVIPRDAISALEPFDLAACLPQTAFLFAGRVTMAEGGHLRTYLSRELGRPRLPPCRQTC